MNKLLILDFDGVISGIKLYDQQGVCTHKQCCDKDWSAIKLLKATNWSVCILSGDKNINEIIANKRKIDFYHNPVDWDLLDQTKQNFLPQFLEHYKVTLHNTYYIGDDFYDLGIMRALPEGNRFCPQDAAECVQNISIVLPVNGGCGVVEQFMSYLERNYRL